jgi:hypothetical protein
MWVNADNTEIFGAVTQNSGDLLGYFVDQDDMLEPGNDEPVDWTLLALSTQSPVNLAG